MTTSPDMFDDAVEAFVDIVTAPAAEGPHATDLTELRGVIIKDVLRRCQQSPEGLTGEALEMYTLQMRLKKAGEAALGHPLSQHPALKALASSAEAVAETVTLAHATPGLVNNARSAANEAEKVIDAAAGTAKKNWVGSVMNNHGGKVAAGVALALAVGGWGLYALSKKNGRAQEDCSSSPPRP